MKIDLKSFESKIGYSFKDRSHLFQALTHSSFAYEYQQNDVPDNEVMEFLGDSVLGLIVADYLCSTYPELAEGDLTKLKSLVTSTAALKGFAENIKLDRAILLGRGEEKSGGRAKSNILAGAFEALLAAIFLDGGLNPARSLLEPLLKSFFKKVNIRKFFINNFKSALQEHLQKSDLPAPRYKTVTATGPNHRREFVVEVWSGTRSLGKAKGSSKKLAEQKAAEKALRDLLGRRMKAFKSNTFLMKKKSR